MDHIESVEHEDALEVASETEAPQLPAEPEQAPEGVAEVAASEGAVEGAAETAELEPGPEGAADVDEPAGTAEESAEVTEPEGTLEEDVEVTEPEGTAEGTEPDEAPEEPVGVAEPEEVPATTAEAAESEEEVGFSAGEVGENGSTLDQAAEMAELAVEDWDYTRPRRGQVRTGIILNIRAEEIIVDIGAKRDGIVPSTDLQRMGEEAIAKLSPGDEVMVFVMRPEDKDGNLLVSLHMARQEKAWKHAKELHDEGEVWEGEVIGYNKGGLVVPVEEIRGFVPASQVPGFPSGLNQEDRLQRLSERVGDKLMVKVIEIDRRKRRLILSATRAQREWRRAQRKRLLSELREGEVRTGRVTSLCSFGAFVDLGGADGLVHLSELSWRRIRHPREVVSVGQEVEVYVLRLDHDRKRIGLSLKRLQPEPWSMVEETYELGQLVEGLVTNVVDFGAFAEIEPGVEGLIHVSELSDIQVSHPRDIVKKGDLLLLRIIRIDARRKRLGLSLKRVLESEWAEWAARLAVAEAEKKKAEEEAKRKEAEARAAEAEAEPEAEEAPAVAAEEVVAEAEEVEEPPAVEAEAESEAEPEGTEAPAEEEIVAEAEAEPEAEEAPAVAVEEVEVEAEAEEVEEPPAVEAEAESEAEPEELEAPVEEELVAEAEPEPEAEEAPAVAVEEVEVVAEAVELEEAEEPPAVEAEAEPEPEGAEAPPPSELVEAVAQAVEDVPSSPAAEPVLAEMADIEIPGAADPEGEEAVVAAEAEGAVVEEVEGTIVANVMETEAAEEAEAPPEAGPDPEEDQ